MRRDTVSRVLVALLVFGMVDQNCPAATLAQDGGVLQANVEFLTELRNIQREYALWIPVSEVGGDVSGAGIVANRHKMQLVEQLLERDFSRSVDQELVDFCQRMIDHAERAEVHAREYADINENTLKEMMDESRSKGFGTDEALASAIGIGFGGLIQRQRPLAALLDIHKAELGYHKEWNRLITNLGRKYGSESPELKALTVKPNATFPLAWIFTPKMLWSEKNPGATQKRPVSVGSLLSPKGFRIPVKSRSWRCFFKLSASQRQADVSFRLSDNEGEIEVLLHDPNQKPALIKTAGTSDARKILTIKPGEPKSHTLNLIRGTYLVEVRHYFKPRFGKQYEESGAEISFWRGSKDEPPVNIATRVLKDPPERSAAPYANPATEFRTWRDKSGKYEVEAKFIRLDGSVVILEKKDGTRIEVESEMLGDSEQGILRNLADSES